VTIRVQPLSHTSTGTEYTEPAPVSDMGHELRQATEHSAPSPSSSAAAYGTSGIAGSKPTETTYGRKDDAWLPTEKQTTPVHPLTIFLA
jgi:hypothetical protein